MYLKRENIILMNVKFSLTHFLQTIKDIYLKRQEVVTALIDCTIVPVKHV